MKEIEKLAENTSYTAVNIGKLTELDGHSLVHPKTRQMVKGKVFLKDATNATGTEISLQKLAPKESLNFFHTHQQNEETYIVISGTGKFQVDDDCFSIEEGSVIRVATKGIRSLCNSSAEEPLIYMVIQSKENSLQQYSTADGNRVANSFKWDV